MRQTAKIKIMAYLDATGLTQKELALKCKITPEGLCRALKRNKLSALLAYKINKYTYGKISYEDLTDDPLPKKKKRRST